jgi:hypothetical protein
VKQLQSERAVCFEQEAEFTVVLVGRSDPYERIAEDAHACVTYQQRRQLRMQRRRSLHERTTRKFDGCSQIASHTATQFRPQKQHNGKTYVEIDDVASKRLYGCTFFFIVMLPAPLVVTRRVSSWIVFGRVDNDNDRGIASLRANHTVASRAARSGE